MLSAYGCAWWTVGVGVGWQGIPMIDHVSLQSDDLAAAVGWYDAVLAPLGVSRVLEFEGVAGYGPTGGPPSFWLRAVHQVAVGLGGEVLHEPREWSEYHPGYYAVFLRDPDGNNVEAVCHGP